ncbi:hypothetical protein D3C80_1500340 [compost metagenome]
MLVAHIHGAHHAAQIRSEEAQDVVAEHGQGQLTEHLLSQLGLAVAQPGLVLQTLRRALLGLKVFIVAGRQRQQVSTAEVRQQTTEADDEQHEGRDRRQSDGTDLFVTGHAQLLFGADQAIEFLADFIGDALAPAIAD